MALTLTRRYKCDNYTIGDLYIDGMWFSNTLEDKDRGLEWGMSDEAIKAIKVKGQTAIPIGTYDVVVNQSPRFNRLLPRLLNVPGFDGILIHRGNYAGFEYDEKGIVLLPGFPILEEKEYIEVY